MNTPKGPADLEPAELVAAMDDLFEMWDRWIGEGKVHISPRSEYAKTQQQVASIITLTQHLFELAKVIRPYLPDDLPITLVPVAREALETGVWVVWMDRFKDASAAAINEAERNRRALARSMVDSELLSSEDAAKLPEWADLPTDSGPHARWFEQMTKSLKLPDIYAFYRILSQHSHPGVRVMDEYVDKQDDGSPVFLAHATPGSESMLAARIVPLFVLKGARILTYMTRDEAQRREVRAVGQRMNVKVDTLFVRH